MFCAGVIFIQGKGLKASISLECLFSRLLAQLVVAILLKRQGSVTHFLEGIFCRESSSLSLAASSFVASIAFCVAMTDAINLILDAIDGAIYCGKM